MQSTFLKGTTLVGILLLASLFSLSFSSSVMPVNAQQEIPTDEQILKNLGGAGKVPFGLDAQEATTGRTKTSVGGVIGSIIQIILGFTGTIAFIVFLYGGFLWLTARGNEQQVEQAKKYLTNGVLGTIVIILAYSVTYFITDVLFRATQ